MKFTGKMAVLILVIFLNIHLIQEATPTSYFIEYPRLINHQSTDNPTRILAEVDDNKGYTTNPSVVIDIQKESIDWRSSNDNPITLPSPRVIAANYMFNLTCDIPEVFWKVFAPNGSILIDQKISMEIPNTATVRGFLWFVSEVLNCAFLVYIYEDWSLYNESAGEYNILSGYIVISSFDGNSSKTIKITQSKTLYVVAGAQEFLREVDVSSRYDYGVRPIIYDEERIVTFINFVSGGLDFCHFSIENGLEYLTNFESLIEEKIWNIHSKQLIILGGRSAELINYNSSQEIETIKITFSEAQLFYFLPKSLSFPPLQVLVIVLSLIVLFLKTRK